MSDDFPTGPEAELIRKGPEYEMFNSLRDAMIAFAKIKWQVDKDEQQELSFDYPQELTADDIQRWCNGYDIPFGPLLLYLTDNILAQFGVSPEDVATAPDEVLDVVAKATMIGFLGFGIGLLHHRRNTQLVQLLRESWRDEDKQRADELSELIELFLERDGQH